MVLTAPGGKKTNDLRLSDMCCASVFIITLSTAMRACGSHKDNKQARHPAPSPLPVHDSDDQAVGGDSLPSASLSPRLLALTSSYLHLVSSPPLRLSPFLLAFSSPSSRLLPPSASTTSPRLFILASSLLPLLRLLLQLLPGSPLHHHHNTKR